MAVERFGVTCSAHGAKVRHVKDTRPATAYRGCALSLEKTVKQDSLPGYKIVIALLVWILLWIAGAARSRGR